jgi:acyl-CoA synthetase (NDP forming)
MTAGEIISRARADGRPALSEADGKALLAKFGIAIPRSAVASTAEDAAAKAAALTPPFAVKIISPDILHKRAGWLKRWPRRVTKWSSAA